MSSTGNETAPEGAVFVCSACGKRSQDRFGFKRIDEGWDESCMLHAVLCSESSLVFKNGRVLKADAVGSSREI